MSESNIVTQQWSRIFQDALIEKKHNGRMVIDQQGLIDAWKNARATVADDGKPAVTPFMLQAVKQFNNSFARHGSFKDWITLHNLDEVFFINQMTQDDRYSAIVERLTTAEVGNLERERDFVEMAADVRRRRKLSIASDFCKEHAESLSRIDNFRRCINRKWTSTREKEAQARLLKLASFTKGFKHNIRTPSLRMNIREGSSKEPVWVDVKTGIQSMSYYCAYSPGTYIFRFQNRDEAEAKDLAQQEWLDLAQHRKPQESFRPLLRLPNLEWQEKEWNGWNRLTETELAAELPPFIPSYNGGRQAETRVLEATPDREAALNLTYCGFVPRHLKEHDARLGEIVGRVLHIIVATLTFAEWSASAGNPESVAEIGQRMQKITTSDLYRIGWYWALHFPSDAAFPEELRDVFRNSLVMTEFVDLVGMLHQPTDGALVQLCAMICQATDWTPGEMVTIESSRQADTALKMLLSRFDENKFFVFQDETIGLNNILQLHLHFADESYTLDPNHPQRQYNTPADFADSTAKEYIFLHSLEPLWVKAFEGFDQAEVAAQEAQVAAQEAQVAAQEAQVAAQGAQVAAQEAQAAAQEPESFTGLSGSNPQYINPRLLWQDPASSQTGNQSVEAPVRRGRGRPKGRLNNKTIERQRAQAQYLANLAAAVQASEGDAEAAAATQASEGDAEAVAANNNPTQ